MVEELLNVLWYLDTIALCTYMALAGISGGMLVWIILGPVQRHVARKRK